MVNQEKQKKSNRVGALQTLRLIIKLVKVFKLYNFIIKFPLLLIFVFSFALFFFSFAFAKAKDKNKIGKVKKQNQEKLLAKVSFWKKKNTELDWLSVPLLKGKFLVQIQMFSKKKVKQKRSGTLSYAQPSIDFSKG